VLPDGHDRSLAEWMMRHPTARRGSPREQLEAACATAAERLLLDGCAALEVNPAGVREAARIGRTRLPGAVLTATLPALAGRGPIGLDDPRLAGASRQALEAAGVSWVLPVGEDRPRAMLLLGRRLSGAWLSVPEMRELDRFAHQLDVLLENAQLREVATAHGAYDRDLTRAQTIQAHFLPRHTPAYPSLDCAAGALSTEPVGGDYYDFVKSRGRVLTLAVGDAAGHGVPAALVGVWAQACFRGEARRGSRPGQVLAALNRELVSMDQPESFVALVCAQVEVPTARLHYSNAGLTPPLLRRRDGRCETLAESGVLLGVTPEAVYEDAVVDLKAGDIVVLHTDGLTEARRGDELFGPERVAEALHRVAEKRAAEIVRALMTEVQAFADHPLDDLTVVVIKQLTQPRRAGLRLKGPLKWRPTPADALR
jgi:serine phosphatase RsbU (regulator of sigma subunit)